MKNLIKRLVIKLYWRLNCHTLEPFSDQILVNVVPGSVKSKRDLTTIVFQLKHKGEEFFDRVILEAIAAENADLKIKFKDFDLKKGNKEVK